MRLVNAEVRFVKRGGDGAEVERGFEQQRWLFRDDGTATLTAFSLARDLGVARDVIVNLDAGLRPIDAYCRIHLGDRLEGSGWFRFGADAVEADLWNAAKGLVRERREVAGGARAFSGHPIACDILLAMAYDRAAGPGVQPVDRLFLSSAHHFGAEGPEIAQVAVELDHVGVETIDTPCGAFETDHWRILAGNATSGHTHPGEDMWALRDTPIFVAAAIPAIGYRYALMRFEDRML